MDLINPIATTLEKVPLSWNRVILAVRAADCVPLCAKHLPGYQFCCAGPSTSAAEEFLSARPNVESYVFQQSLMDRRGRAFAHNLVSKGHVVYLEMADTNVLMRHAMDLQVHGVIVDDPARFVESTSQQSVSRIPALWEWFLTKCARLTVRRYETLKQLLPYLDILMATYHKHLPITGL